MNKPAVVIASAFVLVGSATAAFAHHSTANYDNQKTTDIKAVVKELEAVNPHMRLTVVAQVAGAPKTMMFEGQSVQNMYRVGYRRGMLKEGDTVTVNYSPLKEGAVGYAGIFWAITTADGHQIGKPRANAPGTGAPTAPAR